MKAVIDTNIFMAALINRRGAPAKIRQRWLDGQFTLITSPPIEFEYADVLLHAPKVQSDDVQVLLEEVQALSLVVPVSGSLKVCKDPDDDVFLETAMAEELIFLLRRILNISPQNLTKESKSSRYQLSCVNWRRLHRDIPMPAKLDFAYPTPPFFCTAHAILDVVGDDEVQFLVYNKNVGRYNAFEAMP